MDYIIVPAIIAKTQAELDKMLTRIERKVERVMLDLMDGKFVPNTSLNFDFRIHPEYEYEAHMMVTNPEDYIDQIKGKVKWAILHYETLNKPTETIRKFKNNGFKRNLRTNSLQVILNLIQE